MSPREIPRDPRPDASIALLREGYRFISNLCDRLGSDVVATRLQLREAICLRGGAATRLFYGTDGLTRLGAMPSSVLHLLQDEGSVQQLEGPAHRHRKALFTTLVMEPGRVGALVAEVRRAWHEALEDWERRETIVLQVEAARVLTTAACRWTGIAAGPDEALASTVFEMIDATGSLGPRNWLARFRRSGLERRLAGLVETARAEGAAPADTALHALAHHHDLSGTPLTPGAAAVELLNILRPTVAIGRYITFAALALHREGTWCDLFRAGNLHLAGDFAEEVRRVAPFFPMVAAITTRTLDWQGYQFPKGQWLLLDVYGTTHDARNFPEPGRFKAQRMLSWQGQDDCFIPQGGGAVATTHRCPGERATVEVLKEAIRLLCCDMSYDVPRQDLGIRLTRIPAQPRSGMILAGVRRRAAPAP